MHTVSDPFMPLGGLQVILSLDGASLLKLLALGYE